MEKKNYNESFRQNAVKVLLSPGSGSIKATAEKLDIHPSTLFSWKKKYATSQSMTKSKKIENLSPEQKLEIVIKTASMTEEQLGEFLRTNGLHSSDLEIMKKDLLDNKNSKGRPKLDPELVELRKKVKSLSSDIKRKDKALAEYSARVILLKKSHEIWGTGEEDE